MNNRVYLKIIYWFCSKIFFCLILSISFDFVRWYKFRNKYTFFAFLLFTLVRWENIIFRYVAFYHNRLYLIIITRIREKNAFAIFLIELTIFQVRVVYIVAFFLVALRIVNVRNAFDRLWTCRVQFLHAFLTCFTYFVEHVVIKIRFCINQYRVYVRMMFLNAFFLVFALVKRSIITRIFWDNVDRNENYDCNCWDCEREFNNRKFWYVSCLLNNVQILDYAH